MITAEAKINPLQIFLLVVLSLGIVGLSFYLQIYSLLAIPLFFFFAVGVFYKPDILFFALALFTPLSINPHDAELGKLSLSLPTEPIAALLVLMFLYLVLSSNKIDKRFLKHPVSILLYIYFAWLCITTLTSVDKLVSVKFVIAKIWFIIPCYFLAAVYFREPQSLYRYFLFFILGMVIISSYNIIHLSQYGFEDKPSQYTMQPFFKDHTVLGAISAMTIPLCFGFFRLSFDDVVKRLFTFMSILILLAGTLITYSRAAWASIVPAILLLLVFEFRIRFRWLLFAFACVLVYVFTNMDGLLMELERNKVAGSDDLVENAESITNISSDPSNLERINRWASAIEMWKDKPLFGFGPGTYMFEYAPYQISRNYTSISTNFGDVGNAHSEYLGPLAETGLPGLLLFFSLFIMTMYYAMRAFYRNQDRNHRILISTLACSVITYFVHGFLNNFLDTDKASNIFWPIIAALVVYDLKNAPGNEKAEFL